MSEELQGVVVCHGGMARAMIEAAEADGEVGGAGGHGYLRR